MFQKCGFNNKKVPKNAGVPLKKWQCEYWDNSYYLYQACHIFLLMSDK